MQNIAIIWDVDGTLVDTAEQHFRAWQTLADEIGHPFTRDDFAATFGMRNPEIVRQLFDPQATEEKCQAIGERKELLYRASVEQLGVNLLPGVSNLLNDFANAGWPQAVGSSAPPANLDLLLRVTKTRHYFQAVVSGNDVSHGKPHPEVFLKAADALGVSPETCVVLEDAVSGVQAAKAANMTCVAVTFVGHHPKEKLTAAGADQVVDSLASLDWQSLLQLKNV